MSAFYFNFLYQRFLASTQGWKDDAVGAYLRLLIYQFDNNGLPDDFKFLCSLSTSLKKNKELIMSKFKLCEDGRLRNHVMHNEFLRSQNVLNKNRENGQKGGRPKNPTVNPNETERLTQTKPKKNRTANPKKSHTNNHNQEEEKKEFSSSSLANPPLLQTDVIQQTANKVFKDKGWKENIMMGHRIQEKDLLSWMAQFNATLTTYVVAEFSESVYKRLFASWLNNQKAKGYQLQNENSILSGPQLKILN